MVNKLQSWAKNGLFCIAVSVAIVSGAFLALSFWTPFQEFFLSHTSRGSFIFYEIISLAMLMASLALLRFKSKIERLIDGYAGDISDLADALQKEEATKLHLGPACNGSLALNAALYGAALIVGLYSLYLGFFHADHYRHFINEDGPIEYGSSFMWLFAALGGSLSFVLSRHQPKLGKIAYICMILFFVACGGEEISWGQRIFGFEGSDALLAVNKQHELNLHDIGSISFFSNAFFLLTLIFFVGIPWLERKYPQLKLLARYSGLPSPSLHATRIYLIGFAVWVAVGVRFGTLGFHPFSLWGYYTQMDDEIFEFFAAYAFFAFICFDLTLKLQESKSQHLRLSV